MNYGKQVSVLNIYPNREDSNTLKTWMDSLELLDIEGQSLINVTPVSYNNFNSDPLYYLKDGNGEWQYDVLMLGTWDGNNSSYMDEQSSKYLEEFADDGRGILFGHDVLVANATHAEGNKYLEPFAERLGLTFNARLNSSTRQTGSTEIQVVNNGYLMKYPFEIKDNAVLNIPLTHNIELSRKDTGTVWLEFINPSANYANPIFDDGEYRGGWYLKTNNNLAMIQTGHSNGTSTMDESKIIANTIYNLAQVSLTANALDHTVSDTVEPDTPKVSYSEDNSLEEFTIDIDSIDKGQEYQFYVEASTKNQGVLTSDIVQETITSNIAGYFYRFKTDNYNEEDFLNEVEGFKNEFGRMPKDVYDLYVAPETGSLTEYDTTASLTLNGRELFEEYGAEDLSLMVIAVDRANNVSQVTTEHLEPLLLELIPEVEVTIDPLTEHPQEVHSYTITGTATPNSFIRFSGDAAIPEGTIVTPHADSNEKFHTIADDEGNYSFVLPECSHFTGGNEVVAYAFFDWKSATDSTIVTDGFLTLDFVSPIDFGNQKIAAQDRTYYAHSYVASDEEQPNYVQISDRRAEGDRDGWQLAVTQRAQFRGEKDQYLEGAVLRLENAELIGSADNEPRKETSVIELMPAAQEILVHASDYQDKGTWKFCFGDQASADKSIALDVPSGANPEAIRYSATLDWVLISGPSN